MKRPFKPRPDFSPIGATLFVLAFVVAMVFFFGNAALYRGDPNANVDSFSLAPWRAAGETLLQLWFSGACGVVGALGSYVFTRGRGPMWPMIAGLVLGIIAGLWLLAPLLPPDPELALG